MPVSVCGTEALAGVWLSAEESGDLWAKWLGEDGIILHVRKKFPVIEVPESECYTIFSVGGSIVYWLQSWT